jgi:acid phosphatase
MANGRGLELVNARRSGGRHLRVWARSLAAEVLGRATELADAFAQRAADTWNASEDMVYLNKRIGKWMPLDSDGKPGAIAVDSHPRLSGIMDTVNATLAHGNETRLPSEFYDEKLRTSLDKIAVDEWFRGYRESNEYRALGIGSLLGDVVERMVHSVEHTASAAASAPPPVRLGLSGCHDTTLAATLTSLGAFENAKWPPFTSHIAIELFRATQQQEQPPPATAVSASSWLPSFLRSRTTSIGRRAVSTLSPSEKDKMSGYYVRLRYNDTPVTIPGCRPAGKHFGDDESFCTLVSS